ncbi:hypothetical protein [Sinomonas sp. P10A9]|uniref:Uncharacterized protein n=1 Tax=Sinomonas puerhi TaxID=3238584 RepID=A0AB39L7J9_9MICC
MPDAAEPDAGGPDVIPVPDATPQPEGASELAAAPVLVPDTLSRPVPGLVPGAAPDPRQGGSRDERRSLLRWTVFPVLAGLVLGTVWVVAAPGGLLYGLGTEYAAWDERDLVFAGLGLIAGLAIAVVLAATRRRVGLPNRGLAALAGSVLGSLAAWGTGVGLGRVLGARGVSASVAESAFGLQAVSSLAVWPCVVALMVLALTTLWWAPPRE